MVNFADNAWHVISGFLFILLGFAVAFRQRKIFEIPINTSVIFYLWHTIFCSFYIYYSSYNISDSVGYYNVALSGDVNLNIGTSGIEYISYILVNFLGMSYAGAFFVFNIFGFIGMLALYSAMRSVMNQKANASRLVPIVIMLLPGLSFWSCAIGKDSIIFCGVGLACWSAMNLRERYISMVVAVALFIFARPHMAGVLVFALSVSIIVVMRTGFAQKVALTIVFVPISLFGIYLGAQFSGINQNGRFADVKGFLEERQGYNMEGGGTIDIASMSLPVKFFSYLFRPLFFDANNIMGLASSVENLIILAVFLYYGRFAIIGKSNLSLFIRVFFLIFSISSLFLLANTTSNLGISVRQKWMFLPMILLLLISYYRATEPKKIGF